MIVSRFVLLYCINYFIDDKSWAPGYFSLFQFQIISYYFPDWVLLCSAHPSFVHDQGWLGAYASLAGTLIIVFSSRLTILIILIPTTTVSLGLCESSPTLTPCYIFNMTCLILASSLRLLNSIESQ